jgi:hypothetical protein
MLRMIRMLRISSMWRYSSYRQSLFLFCLSRRRGLFGELKPARAALPNKFQPWCYDSWTPSGAILNDPDHPEHPYNAPS